MTPRPVPQIRVSPKGCTSENFSVTGGVGTLITQHGNGVNLRGLGQRATLVLVNGKRLAPSGNGSFVDVSLIPLSAVDRIEILTDGASAIYGSDAVGGVVNFILKRDFSGFETELRAGSATRGDGDLIQLSQAVGHRWSGGSALLTYEYREQDEVLAKDRPYATLPPNSFFLPRETRQSLLASLNQELTDRLTLGAMAVYGRSRSRRDFFVGNSALIVDAQARASEFTISGDLTYRLGSGWTAQLTGIYSLTETDQDMNFTDGQGGFNDTVTYNEMSEVGLKFDGPLIHLPGGTVRAAIGGALRGEHHQTQSKGAAQINSGGPATVRTAQQGIRAVYGEIIVPLFGPGNARPGFSRLELNGAARLEQYSKYGTTLNPKLGVVWSPFADLRLKGSYSTSFRAPLLVESIGIYNATYNRALNIYLNPAEAVGVPLDLGGSNPDLKPETSVSWTAGLEYTPAFLPGLKIGSNYFRTDFRDRIASPTSTLTVVGNPAFEPIIIRNPSVELVRQFLAGATNVTDVSGPGGRANNARPEDVTLILDRRTSNTAITHVEGMDFDISYAFEWGPNRFRLSANGTYMFTFKDQLTIAAIPIENVDTLFKPLDFRGRAGIGWSRGGFNANLFVNYADDYRDTRGLIVEPVASDTTVDMTLAYTFPEQGSSWLRGTRLSLTALNIFDNFPPSVAPDRGSARSKGYDPTNASGMGRFISVQLRKRW